MLAEGFVLADLTDLSLMAILLLAAAVFYMLEVCTPSFGIMAGIALCAQIGGIYSAFSHDAMLGVIVLFANLIGTPVFLVYMVKFLPKTPLGKRMFLKKSRNATSEATPEAEELAELVGLQGTAETTLRPSGVIRIDGRRVDARAEQGMIEKGQAVKVIQAGGTDVVVREVFE